MPIMDTPPVKPTPRTSTQGTLRLTREEVRVLHYYRALPDSDREAVRCLMQALQAPQPKLPQPPAATSHAAPTTHARTHVA